jgi:glycolate oxidase
MVTLRAWRADDRLLQPLRGQGLFFPPDPGSWKYSTIGGNVAENAGGGCGR